MKETADESRAGGVGLGVRSPRLFSKRVLVGSLQFHLFAQGSFHEADAIMNPHKHSHRTREHSVWELTELGGNLPRSLPDTQSHREPGLLHPG